MFTVEDVKARLRGRPIELVEYAGRTAGMSTFKCTNTSCGHVWRATLNNVTHSRNPTGCPKCAPNARVNTDEAFRRLEGLSIEMIRYCGTTNGHSDFRCKECGHEWTVSLAHVLSGTGCAPCAYRANAIAARMTYEEALDRVSGLGITLLRYGGKCSADSDFECTVCGHTWSTTVNAITCGSGCPACAGTMRVTLEEAVERLCGRNIEIVEYGGKSNAQSRFRCTVEGCGHEWVTTFTSVDGGSGCRACAGSVPWTEDRLRAELVDKSIDLLHFVPGSSSKSMFKCLDPECGYVWSTTIRSVSRSRGCPKCSGSVPVTEEDARQRLKGRPIELVRYAGKVRLPSRFRCTKPGCGHEWEVSFNSLDNRGTGCPACAEYGFNPNKPATFYVYRIYCCSHNYLGFGITRNFDERNTRHQKSFRDHGATGELIFTHAGHGKDIHELERTVKNQFDIVNTGIPGFQEEATMFADWKVAVLRSLCLTMAPEPTKEVETTCV